LLAFVSILDGSAAGHAEPSEQNVVIEFERLPVISVTANGASLREILDRLAGPLRFTIEAPTSVEHSPTFRGSYKGEVTDVLRRVLLREVNYVIFYQGSTIERIVIVDSSATVPGSEKPASGTLAGASDALSTDAANAVRAVFPSSSSPDTQAVQSRNPVVRLLQAQANLIRPTVTTPDASGSATTSATSSRPLTPAAPSSGSAQMSLAAMTQAAQANVRSLAKALNSVCIGGSCGQ
jgi:hypothetical protein